MGSNFDPNKTPPILLKCQKCFLKKCNMLNMQVSYHIDLMLIYMYFELKVKGFKVHRYELLISQFHLFGFFFDIYWSKSLSNLFPKSAAKFRQVLKILARSIKIWHRSYLTVWSITDSFAYLGLSILRGK